MGTNPHANGGLVLRDLRLPAFQDFAVEVPSPGATTVEATRVQGRYVAAVMRENLPSRNFRVFSPDENASNRWQDLFNVTARGFVGEILPTDDHIAPDGRVMEMLSEHQCQGWLEGYLLTGRHGFFNCYEAFIHIIDSMFNQHAKWLKICNHIGWRRPIASLNYLLSSHVWRQDHNGFSHQDPGFIDHVVNKKAEIIRVYLPPDANCLLHVTDRCLRSRNLVNVIVAGKQPGAAVAVDGRGDQALRCRDRHLGMGQQRSRHRARRRDGLLRRRADARNAGRRGSAQAPRARVENPRGERRRPDDPPATLSPPLGSQRLRLRRALHPRSPRGVRVPRVSVADPSPHLSPNQSLEHPRARVQGGRARPPPRSTCAS